MDGEKHSKSTQYQIDNPFTVASVVKYVNICCKHYLKFNIRIYAHTDFYVIIDKYYIIIF